jgi:hypothetical protein
MPIIGRMNTGVAAKLSKRTVIVWNESYEVELPKSS